MVPTNSLNHHLLVPLVALVAFGGCGDDGDGRDIASFCTAVDALEAADPFGELQVASPEEMRAAFDELTAGASQIADVAPSQVRTQAETYRDSVDELTQQLRGAGYDPRDVDGLAYRRAAADYEAAAVSVENAAASMCS